MTAKKPHPAPDQSAMVRHPTSPPPPRVQSTACTTCDAMAAKMLRMEEALRVIRILTDPDWADMKHSETMKHIHDRADDAILGR